MKNQAGFVTVEFMFAIVIATCLTILTFSLTFTLSVVEVVQYMVYSAARAHSAANLNIDAQQKAAKDKYTALWSNKTFAPLFQNGWFEAPPAKLEIKSGNGDNFETTYGPAVNKNAQGVRVTFTAHMLEKNFPLIGSVTSPSGNGFEAKINALLIREISQEECYDYMKKDRLRALWDLTTGTKSFEKPFSGLWEDNGC